MTTTNRELTKREIALREQIFLRDLGATDVDVAKPPEPRHTSKVTDQPLDDFAPENFAPENFAPENFAPEDSAPGVFVRPNHVSVPLKPKSRAHPVALTCLGIITAVFAFLVVERSTEPVSPPIPPKEPSAISEVDKSTLPPVSADNPPPVVDVPVTPSTPALVPESTPVPEPEIAKAPPPKPVLPVAPRNDAPRARPPAPSVSRQPPSTARLDPPLSQRPPVVAGAPEPPSRPAADPPAVPPAAVDASAPRPIAEPGLAPAPAPTPTPTPSPPPAAPPTAAALPPASPPSAAPPAAAPSAAAASASAIQSNTKGIETTLARYRKAFSALDAGAARAVWPTVNQGSLSRAFERLEQQEVSFEGCQIVDVNDARAEATCQGTASYVPRVGNRTPRVDRRSWRFSLVKVREEWLIGAVEPR